MVLKLRTQVLQAFAATSVLALTACDSGEATDVKADVEKVEAGKDGANVNAGGVKVKAGAGGAEVETPDVKVEAGSKGAGVKTVGDAETKPETKTEKVVRVRTGEGGSKVEANGTKVKTGPEGTKVEAGGVKVNVGKDGGVDLSGI